MPGSSSDLPTEKGMGSTDRGLGSFIAGALGGGGRPQQGYSSGGYGGGGYGYSNNYNNQNYNQGYNQQGYNQNYNQNYGQQHSGTFNSFRKSGGTTGWDETTNINVMC
jgi:hypothetical protein